LDVKRVILQVALLCGFVFTHMMLASAGISCRCMSVFLSQVGVLLKLLNV